MPRYGTCKLTLKQGRFVDSHLIPKALTRPERPGLPFIQTGFGLPPSRRWSSWYDGALVIREGENILARLDSWAIRTLRKNRMVWSGWGPERELGANHSAIEGTGYGFRILDGIDGRRLRLFFLSLLWRAAASDRFEVAEIILPADELERLRELVLQDNAGSADFYPVSLTQLSTLGEIQNLTPIAQTKIIRSLDDTPDKEMPIFRFYLDGLIAHVHRHSSDNGYTESLGNLIVGGAADLMVSTVSYDVSFQRENLEYFRNEALQKWPDLMRKL